jgi:hypothetical protein
MARLGREIAYDQHGVLGALAMAQETEHRRFPVLGVHPREAIAGEVLLVERRMRAVTAIQVADPALQAAVQWVLKNVPFQAFFVRPFAPLSELTAHEQQLLARMGPHLPVQRAQIGELLPFVARHLANQRALAVHDFIVRQRKKEILGKGIPDAE